jgi:hypothetical protein
MDTRRIILVLPSYLSGKAKLAQHPSVKQTCKVCGWSETRPFGVHNPAPGAIEHQVDWWNQCGGAKGRCPGCERQARDEQYPLPKGE